MNLSQAEANFLIRVHKEPTEKNLKFNYMKHIIPLKSSQSKEDFLLDVTPNRIRLTKITYQMRVRRSIILMRLDLEGPPHRNPDDEEIPCPHLHVYKEGYGDKWAYPLPDNFKNCNSIMEYLDKFCDICNINGNPFQLILNI